nr:hypothetical protein [Treponema putidum]
MNKEISFFLCKEKKELLSGLIAALIPRFHAAEKNFHPLKSEVLMLLKKNTFL